MQKQNKYAVLYRRCHVFVTYVLVIYLSGVIQKKQRCFPIISGLRIKYNRRLDLTIEYIFDGILAFHHVLFICYMIT